MKVFVVTRDYRLSDDYCICGVADTMKQAEKLAEYFRDPDCLVSIEIYDTDDIKDIYDKKRWKITYTLPSNSIRVTEEKPEDINELLKEPEIREHKDCHGNYCYVTEITAKDEEHALKIFWDKFAEYMLNSRILHYKGGNK